MAQVCIQFHTSLGTPLSSNSNWPSIKNKAIFLFDNREFIMLNTRIFPPVFGLPARSSSKRIQRSSVHEINHAIIKNMAAQSLFFDILLTAPLH